MNEIAIHTENLSRHFGAVRAVDGLSLDVPAGSVFGFLGPNGSGKTTTIRLLLGLLLPTAGQASVLGWDTRTQADEIRRRCGALLEHSGLYERLSAEDNLEFYGRIAHLPPAERRTRMRELLERAGLWERRREPAGRWSRGMQQKLAVARALLHRPRLLFLDEPTAGLDPLAAAALRSDLARMVQSEGVTVFLTTHNLVEAEHLCARVAVIRRGRLLDVGSPQELRAHAGGGAVRVELFGRGLDARVVALLQARPEVSSVRSQDDHVEIELLQGSDVAPLVAAVVGAGAEVEEVRKGSASLEQAFLELVGDEGPAASADPREERGAR